MSRRHLQVIRLRRCPTERDKEGKEQRCAHGYWDHWFATHSAGLVFRNKEQWARDRKLGERN